MRNESARAAGEQCCRLIGAVDEPADRVYFNNSGDGRLLALDAGNGDVRATIPNSWTADLLGADPEGRMLVVADGH